MSNIKKNMHIIEFLGKKANWESWSKKFLSHLTCKGYKKLFWSSELMVDKIPKQNEYDDALEGDTDLNKKVIKLDECYRLA